MRFGDVITVDLGSPVGSEAGFVRPAVVVMSDAFLAFGPTTVFVVPLSSRRPTFPSHIEIEPDAANGLARSSTVQVEQLRAVSTGRCAATGGNVGPLVGAQILDIVSMIIGT